MSKRPTPATPIFPTAVTWLGVIILATGMVTQLAPSAHASTSAPATQGAQWSTMNPETGVLTGGHSADFSSGVLGWSPPVFDSLGTIGIEWSSVQDPARRIVYSGSEQSETVVQGADSQWNSTGLLSPMPSQVLIATHNTAISEQQARWTTRLESLHLGSMMDNRFYWMAMLPVEYQPVYTQQTSNSVVMSDAGNRYATVILQGSSTEGEVQWGGTGRFDTPLENGERNPTFYVHDTIAMDLTITVTIGIIDHDPCQRSESEDFAATQSGAWGVSWPPLTSCLNPSTWVATAQDDEPTSLSLTMDPLVPDLPSGATRRVDIIGLPDGVTWTREPDTSGALNFTLLVPSTTPAGEAPLVVNAFTTSTTAGVQRISEPLRTTASLTIEPMAAPVDPVVPELVIEDEDDTTAFAPEPAQRTSSPPETPAAVEPVIPREELAIRQDPLVIEEVPRDAPTVAPTSPIEQERWAPPAQRVLPPQQPNPPELSLGAAWLGASMAFVGLGSWLFAIIRRRRIERES